MNRLDIINHLIKKNNYKTYGEIGVFTGFTLDGCIAEDKRGIDPQCGHYKGSNRIFCMTSDDYFATVGKDIMLDCWFIDGLHESSQVDRDIQNALKHLSEGGMIVLHDCLPTSIEMVTTGTVNGEWTGDTYKSYIKILSSGFRCYLVDTDYGVGVYKPEYPLKEAEHLSKVKNNESFDFQWLMENKSLLKVVTPEEFLKIEIIPEKV